MITKNWFLAFKTYYAYYLDAGPVNGVDTSGKSKPLYGDQTWKAIYPIHGASELSTNTITSSGGIFFGDGNTPPTKDDYTLSGNQITTLVRKSSTTDRSFDENGASVTTNFIVENTGSFAVTVKEVAWVALLRSSSSGNGYFLLDRTLLDSPVTVEPGGIAKITYTRSIALPTP